MIWDGPRGGTKKQKANLYTTTFTAAAAMSVVFSFVLEPETTWKHKGSSFRVCLMAYDLVFYLVLDLRGKGKGRAKCSLPRSHLFVFISWFKYYFRSKRKRKKKRWKVEKHIGSIEWEALELIRSNIHLPYLSCGRVPYDSRMGDGVWKSWNLFKWVPR